jgi:hypothetical protein
MNAPKIVLTSKLCYLSGSQQFHELIVLNPKRITQHGFYRRNSAFKIPGNQRVNNGHNIAKMLKFYLNPKQNKQKQELKLLFPRNQSNFHHLK